jgi:hypothetical protein
MSIRLGHGLTPLVEMRLDGNVVRYKLFGQNIAHGEHHQLCIQQSAEISCLLSIDKEALFKMKSAPLRQLWFFPDYSVVYGNSATCRARLMATVT